MECTTARTAVGLAKEVKGLLGEARVGGEERLQTARYICVRGVVSRLGMRTDVHAGYRTRIAQY